MNEEIEHAAPQQWFAKDMLPDRAKVTHGSAQFSNAGEALGFVEQLDASQNWTRLRWRRYLGLPPEIVRWMPTKRRRRQGISHTPVIYSRDQGPEK